MIKKIIVISAAVLIILTLFIYLIFKPNVLGNISQSYAEKTTGTSDVSFNGEAGDRIKFHFKSDIQNGNLDIILYDSNDNIVYELDKAKESVTFLTLNCSGTYRLSAKYKDFVGEYDIEIFCE